MKVSKSALREVLAVEIRSLIREEVQRELKAMFKSDPRSPKPRTPRTPTKAPKSRNKYSVMDSLTQDEPIRESATKRKINQSNTPFNTKRVLNIEDPADFNTLLETADIPNGYYKNSQITGNANTAQPSGEINRNYQTTSVQSAEDVDGDDLNSLENTNFNAFLT